MYPNFYLLCQSSLKCNIIFLLEDLLLFIRFDDDDDDYDDDDDDIDNELFLRMVDR